MLHDTDHPYCPYYWESKQAAVRCVEHCLGDIRELWMGSNFLKLNDDKTLAIVAHTRRRLSHGITVINLGEFDITPSPWARNIRRGV